MKPILNYRNMAACVLWLCGMLFATGGKAANAAPDGHPFRGVWISDTPEEYAKLQIDLYSKSVYVDREEGEPFFGYYQMENEYAGDYWVITDVISVGEDKAQVAVYSYRYGSPDDKTRATLTYNKQTGAMSFREKTFTKANACRYVEIMKPGIRAVASPTDKTPVGLAPYGQACDLLDYDRGFYKVRTAGGRVGYVSDEYANPLLSNTIPVKAFEATYSSTKEVGYFAYLGFYKKGNNVFMEIQNISIPPDKTAYDGHYSGSSVYYGTIDGNRLVFTKTKDMFGPDLETMNPSELDDVKDGAISAYYSPTREGFVFHGGIFLPL